MKNINSFKIKTSDLLTTASSRQYIVNGEKDAEFILQIFNSSQQFYNFNTKSFSATSTSKSALKVKMTGNRYNGSINFPANGSGDTYTILLITPADKDTILNFGAGKNSYSTTITQLASDVNLTFTTSSATSAGYGTPPTVVYTVSSLSTASISKKISWTLTNTKTDANGFGLRLIRQPIDTDWYFQTTETADGAVASDSNQLVVDDLTDLATGMELTYITGTTAPGAATTIIAIDAATKTLTLSRDQAITDGHTMTFRAYGAGVIKKAIGLDMDFSTWNSNVNTVSLTSPFTKTVRTTVSGDSTARKTVALNNTYGLSGGNHLTVKGLNVNNDGTNTVVSIAADADGSGSDGTMTLVLTQPTTLTAGTVLRFSGSGIGKGSRDTLKIDNEVKVSSYPSSARTIYLDLDKFITLGTAS